MFKIRTCLSYSHRFTYNTLIFINSYTIVIGLSSGDLVKAILHWITGLALRGPSVKMSTVKTEIRKTIRNINGDRMYLILNTTILNHKKS